MQTIITSYGLQHGFRGGRSCETQLVKFIDDLAYNIQNGGQTDVAVAVNF